MENNSTNNSIEDINVIDTVNQDVNIYDGVLNGLKEYIETKTSNSNFDKSFDGTVVGFGSKRGLKVVINGNEYDNIECIENNYKVGDIVKLISPQNVFSDAYVVGIVNKTSNEISTPTVNWLDRFYPVGSVYLTMNDYFDPSSAFGGTWEKLSEGRFLLGASVDDGAGVTGGTVTHTHTVSGITAGHTLGVNEIPEHYHRFEQSYNATDLTQPDTYMGTSDSHNHAIAEQNVSTWTRAIFTGGGSVTGATSEKEHTGVSTYGKVAAHNTGYDGRHRHSFRVKGDTEAYINHTADLGGDPHSHSLSITTSVQSGYANADTEYEVMAAVYPPYITCNMWRRTQ